jgi:hypothetical protein
MKTIPLFRSSHYVGFFFFFFELVVVVFGSIMMTCNEFGSAVLMFASHQTT